MDLGDLMHATANDIQEFIALGIPPSAIELLEEEIAANKTIKNWAQEMGPQVGYGTVH